MNTNLQIFNNTEFGEIRVINIENDIWFVGKDVSEILGYKQTSNMKKLIDKEDLKEINPQTVANTGFIQNGITLEPNPNIKRMLLINESGLYTAIFGSKLETAKKFKHWVTNEVLPSIRKHGAYMTSDVLEASINNPDFMIGLLTELKEEQEQRKLLEIDNERMKPKEEYYDKILKAEGTFNAGQIAKDYGMSAKEFNTLLSNLKIQYKNNGQWLLYKDYQDKGYTKSEDIYKYGKVNKFTRWTPEGRVFLYEILKENGIEPIYNLKA